MNDCIPQADTLCTSTHLITEAIPISSVVRIVPPPAVGLKAVEWKA